MVHGTAWLQAPGILLKWGKTLAHQVRHNPVGTLVKNNDYLVQTFCSTDMHSSFLLEKR